MWPSLEKYYQLVKTYRGATNENEKKNIPRPFDPGPPIFRPPIPGPPIFRPPIPERPIFAMTNSGARASSPGPPMFPTTNSGRRASSPGPPMFPTTNSGASASSPGRPMFPTTNSGARASSPGHPIFTTIPRGASVFSPGRPMFTTVPHGASESSPGGPTFATTNPEASASSPGGPTFATTNPEASASSPEPPTFSATYMITPNDEYYKDYKDAADALIMLSNSSIIKLEDMIRQIVDERHTNWKITLNEYEILLRDSVTLGDSLLLIVLHNNRYIYFRHTFNAWDNINELLSAIIRLQSHAKSKLRE